MNLIPWPYRWLAIAALAVALIGFGWIKGAGHVQAQRDAAAAGELPETARDADAAAAGVALSAVAGTIAANYQACNESAEQLRALQAWVNEMTTSIK
ncbi:hypothetical protein [Isoalcanivorax beigongshangi]|uniref:Uncharacterized protein n=1 Tax=Isoalcanivorax beigongshangi TaxID=3238810 RepID=A0ABV4AGI2_9GAMM